MAKNEKNDLALLKEEIKHLKAKLSMSNSTLLNIIEKSSDGVIIVDQQKMVVYTNYTAIKLFERNIDDLLGEPLESTINISELINNQETTIKVRIPKADGTPTLAEVSVHKTEWNNKPCCIINFRDITEQKKTEEILEYLSTHDFLTDLPNRVLLEQKTDKAIQYAKETGQHMALLYLNLDNFKIINNSLGHTAGDQLLKYIASILQQIIRQGDTVVRMGGDEFVLIINTLRKPEYATKIANTLLDKLNQPYKLKGEKLYTNASIGIAVYPMAGDNPCDLLKNADLAMYIAKKRGKNQSRIYSQELDEKNENKIKIVNGLRNIIRNNELFLEYQPIIEMNGTACRGIEALVRWQHPELGMLPPNDFLPYAEEAGVMLSIGEWVIKQALKDYKKLGLESLLFLTVNMSTNELIAAKIIEVILSYIKASKISTNNLVIELTEATIMCQPDEVLKQFECLSKLGVQLAIDDYGTGYSSLSVLTQLPISILKVDKSFVSGIGKNLNNELIVKSTIQLAHNLGFKVIAEGVEEKQQYEFLKELQCDFVQGYYFSKPLGLKALPEYIKQLKTQ